METTVKTYTLTDLGNSLKSVIEKTYKNHYWVVAEINKLNYYPHSGHAYPELVEKTDGKIVAQFRGQMWKNDFDTANNKFLELLNEPIRDGIKVLMLVKVVFDGMYGLSLQIKAIDPKYSLGDLEAEKNLTLAKLKKEGIYESNKRKTLPLVPKRLAIISVESSKGYADFLQILAQSGEKYCFDLRLFPSILQGEQAVTGIQQQLREIAKTQDEFDAVAIIRGGGGDVGLSCYNNYELSRAVASFPLPVLTGIGHATNLTVTELVAHTNAITPTKLAELLLQHFRRFDDELSRAKEKIRALTEKILRENKQKIDANQRSLVAATKLFTARLLVYLQRQSETFKASTGKQLQRSSLALREQQYRITLSTERMVGNQRGKLNYFAGQVAEKSVRKLEMQQQELTHLERTVAVLHPRSVLQRGFALVRGNGKIITSAKKLKSGQELEIELYDGIVQTKLIEKNENEAS